jgi:hypothetical protein
MLIVLLIYAALSFEILIFSFTSNRLLIAFMSDLARNTYYLYLDAGNFRFSWGLSLNSCCTVILVGNYFTCFWVLLFLILSSLDLSPPVFILFTVFYFGFILSLKSFLWNLFLYIFFIALFLPLFQHIPWTTFHFLLFFTLICLMLIFTVYLL